MRIVLIRNSSTPFSTIPAPHQLGISTQQHRNNSLPPRQSVPISDDSPVIPVNPGRWTPPAATAAGRRKHFHGLADTNRAPPTPSISHQPTLPRGESCQVVIRIRVQRFLSHLMACANPQKGPQTPLAAPTSHINPDQAYLPQQT
jgi:hypothetical protein